MRTLGALPDLLELLKVVDTVVPSAAGTRTSTAKGTDPSGGDGLASEDDARQAGMHGPEVGHSCVEAADGQWGTALSTPVADGCVGRVVRTALLTKSPQIQKPPWTETTAAATGTARRGGEGVGAESLEWRGGGGEWRATGGVGPWESRISHGRQSVARRNRRGATYGRGG